MNSQDSDKNFRAEEVEARDPYPRRTFGYKAKRHCKRFWWLHIIIFCIVFLIIALCLVYVAMPKIAQHGVNESTLETTALKFLNPTSDSVEITQETIVHSPSMYTPTLDPFNATSILVVNGTYNTESILTIPLPKIHALHPKSIQGVENVNVSLNVEQATEYATAIVTQEYVTTALVGKTKLHEGKLPVITIGYNHTTTYKGLNGLQGFNVTDMRINITAKPGETNLHGNAFVPNPSPLTIALGNVTLILSTSKGVVGNSTIDEMTIVPGNNSYPLYGIIDTTAVVGALDNGFVTLFIAANSSIYNGQHLTYYEKALKTASLSLSVNVLQVLADSASS